MDEDLDSLISSTQVSLDHCCERVFLLAAFCINPATALNALDNERLERI